MFLLIQFVQPLIFNSISIAATQQEVYDVILFWGQSNMTGYCGLYNTDAKAQQIIDGAENNEMALTDNGHGDVCKYYSYDMHQMVPDILIGNLAFIDELSDEERKIFEEGYRILNETQRKEWVEAVAAAKEKAANEQKVQFIYPDQEPFKEACMPLHESVLSKNEALKPIYDKIQKYNEMYPSVAE